MRKREWLRGGSSKCPVGKLSNGRKDVNLQAGGATRSWGAQVILFTLPALVSSPARLSAPDSGLGYMMAKTSLPSILVTSFPPEICPEQGYLLQGRLGSSLCSPQLHLHSCSSIWNRAGMNNKGSSGRGRSQMTLCTEDG